MKRTQIQLPDGLYEEVKRVAELQEWSVAEVLRRGAEHMVRCYPPAKAREAWELPLVDDVGPVLARADRWRDLAHDYVDDEPDRSGSR